MDQYQAVKTWLYFREVLPKFPRSLNQFYETQIGGWPMESLHVVNIRTIKKWELKTCDNFVNFRTGGSYISLWVIYTIRKYYQKYIQEDIYNECVIKCSVFRR